MAVDREDASLTGRSISPQLIEKYAVSAPRYTSYPTAADFSQAVTSDVWRETLSNTFFAMPPSPIALYFHIPFCHSLCYFCACHKIIPKNRNLVAPFLEAIKHELAAYKKVVGDHHHVVQIHWGGGTPNYLTREEMGLLSSAIHQTFPRFASSTEFSIEIDPRVSNFETLATLRAIGCNRLSLGIQDFNPAVQRAIHRVQSFVETERLFSRARQLSFESINVDLIYGLPLQTRETFRDTIEKVILLRPERIALYAYAHVPWIQKIQNSFKRFKLASSEERGLIFNDSTQRLLEAGYVHIGMDHFALPHDELARASQQSRLMRNFMGYTTRVADYLLAFGPSAISTVPSCFAQNEKVLEKYFEKTTQNGFAIERGVLCNLDDYMRQSVISELFCHGQINMHNWEQIWQIPFQRKFRTELSLIKEFEEDGLIQYDPHRIVLTPQGKFFVRNIATVFDARIGKYQGSKRAIFSSAV